MSRLTEKELESYDIEIVKNIALEGSINSNMINTMNKDFLIKIILWKDKQSEKWAIGEYLEYKDNFDDTIKFLIRDKFDLSTFMLFQSNNWIDQIFPVIKYVINY